MKILSLFAALLISSLVFSSCKKDNPVVPPVEPPPVVKDTITLSVEGTTHRSIELNIQSTINDSSLKIKLFRVFNSAETLIAEYPILVTDTAIIDDNNGNGLQLNTEYSYYAVTEDTAGQRRDTSNQITARTLAATSHNYTWQEFTIGDSQSELFDVWGTDENNVWAIGLVYLNGRPYGGLYYNGTDWLPDSTVGGSAIYGFSTQDLWVIGGGIFYYNGAIWDNIVERYPILNNNIPYTSCWGTNSNDMYFGNYWGKIIHWNGNNASVMLVPTDIFISDIYGLEHNFIIAVGNKGTLPSTVLIYNGQGWKTVDGLDLNGTLFASAYIVNRQDYYIAGSSSFHYTTDNWHPIPGNMYRIRGNKETGEIVGVGPGNTLVHFNGEDWYNFKNEISQEYNALYGVFLTGNKIFAVGFNATPVAKIFIGTRE